MAQRGVQEVPTVLLASSSPRRAELLHTLGLQPTIVSADIDETPRDAEPGRDLVVRLAVEKVIAGWQRWHRTTVDGVDNATAAHQWLVIAADTVVEIDGVVLGKPEGKADAKQMLMTLSGRAHHVSSGVAVGLASAAGNDLNVIDAVESTTVVMRTLDEPSIDWYVETGEPMDKAGAYGIQGKGGLFVERIDGSYQNVVGLPLTAVDQLIRKHGWPLHQLASEQASQPNATNTVTEIEAN